MYGLILFEFCEKREQGAEIVGGRGGIQVEDGRKGETEEEILCGAAGEVARGEGGEAGEVGA